MPGMDVPKLIGEILSAALRKATKAKTLRAQVILILKGIIRAIKIYIAYKKKESKNIRKIREFLENLLSLIS